MISLSLLQGLQQQMILSQRVYGIAMLRLFWMIHLMLNGQHLLLEKRILLLLLEWKNLKSLWMIRCLRQIHLQVLLHKYRPHPRLLKHLSYNYSLRYKDRIMNILDTNHLLKRNIMSFFTFLFSLNLLQFCFYVNI